MSYRVAQDTIFEDTSITADVDAQEVVDVRHLYGISLQLVWVANAGLGTGNIITEASNDNLDTAEDDSTWTQIDSQVIAADDNSVFFNEADMFYQKIRVRVDWATNTINSVTVKYSGKGI